MREAQQKLVNMYTCDSVVYRCVEIRRCYGSACRVKYLREECILLLSAYLRLNRDYSEIFE